MFLVRQCRGSLFSDLLRKSLTQELFLMSDSTKTQRTFPISVSPIVKKRNAAKFGSLGINPQAKSSSHLKVTEKKLKPGDQSPG
jgi:hypothetical protein